MSVYRCICPKCGFQLTKTIEEVRKMNGPANPPLGGFCNLSFIAWNNKTKCTEMHLGITVNERNCMIKKVKYPHERLSSVYSHEIGCKQCDYLIGYKNAVSHDIILSRYLIDMQLHN